jgi:hypothetical protein
MSPLKIYQSFRDAFRFFREAGAYAKPEKAALQAAGAQASRHAAYHRKIVSVSCAFGVTGFVLGVVGCVAGLTIWKMRPREEAGFLLTSKWAVGMLSLPVGLAMLGVLLGAAAACLFAPRSFLLGPVGQKWMGLVGTRSVAAARLVCCALLLLSGFAAFLAGLVLWATQSVDV